MKKISEGERRKQDLKFLVALVGPFAVGFGVLGAAFGLTALIPFPREESLREYPERRINEIEYHTRDQIFNSADMDMNGLIDEHEAHTARDLKREYLGLIDGNLGNFHRKLDRYTDVSERPELYDTSKTREKLWNYYQKLSRPNG